VTEQPPGIPGDLTVGSYIAGYRLEERIGQGGMAAVFRAYDSRLDRQVALKILAPALASDDAFRQRFIRESRAAAAVDDPHIIPVFEAGEADGVLFIAMRYVRGGDVRSLVDRTGPLPSARAAEIVSQTASALDAAHARGLVHRDVKPANMLLDARQAADRPDHVYLSDFGLSKASLAITGLTTTGQFLGTLDYVAPEQIEGRPVDGRTDQYALACAAFELLCGEPPFHRADGLSVMYAQLSEPPPPLRLRRPDLPGRIDEVMAKALAKAPAERYDSCRDFAAALRQALGLRSSDIGPQAHPVTEIAAAAPAASPGPASQQPPRQPAGAGHTQAAGQPAGGPPTSQAARPDSGLPRPHAPAGDSNWAGRTERLGTMEPDVTSGFGQPDSVRRSWWRSPVPVAGLCAVVLLAGGGAYALASHSPGKGGHGGGKTPVAPTLSLPPCTMTTARAHTLTGVTTATTTLDGSPFGVAGTPDGKYLFVSTGNAVDLLSVTSALAPTVVRTITADHASKGVAVTHNGQYVVAAADSGAVVINVAEAEQGAGNPVAGTLASPHGSGAVEVLISANDEFAFVTLQSSAEMAVFNLRTALTQGFSTSDFVGYVPLGNQPVGMASDGTWLYVASIGGTLSIVSVRTAETSPAGAVTYTVQVGCQPARALLAHNGKVLWVTARASDELLGFSTASLRTNPLHALIATVKVGEVPLGEIFVDGGRRIVIADSNLNGLTSAISSLAVISVPAALAGKQALLGYVATGVLPRELAIQPGGQTLLVTDENSHQVQAIRVADLP
jgi:serine/threonine protein kinase/6-phosphogluconolactonase (cycloisomerase 2 family)